MARRRSSRPSYSWTNFGDVQPNVDISTGSGQFGTTGSNVLTPQTLIRARGKIGLSLNPSAVGESLMLLCGLMQIAGDGFLGNDAPELFTNSDDEASWIWQGALYVHSGDEAAVNENRLHAAIDVDTKAMRKLKPGQTIAFVFQTPAALTQDQAGTYDLTYFFHCLIQQ